MKRYVLLTEGEWRRCVATMRSYGFPPDQWATPIRPLFLDAQVGHFPEPPKPERFVQVSYFSDTQFFGGRRWDYIDGIGDLKIGDRVEAPILGSRKPRKAVVVALGRGQDWPGPWSTIARRLDEDTPRLRTMRTQPF